MADAGRNHQSPIVGGVEYRELHRLTMFRTFVLAAALLFPDYLYAQEVGAGEVLRVDTHEGVSVPIYTYWQTNAVATVVLFSGGAGGYGQIGEDGWPADGRH